MGHTQAHRGRTKVLSLLLSLFLFALPRPSDAGHQPYPTKIGGSNNYASYAVMSDGTVMAWGNNPAGQFSDGTQLPRHTPTPMKVCRDGGGKLLGATLDMSCEALGGALSTLVGAADVAAGENFAMVLMRDGTVLSVGLNLSGELGHGDSPILRLTALPVKNLTGVTAVAGGRFHGVALRADGTVWSWGANAFGQLGDGTFEARNVPGQVMVCRGANGAALGVSAADCPGAGGTLTPLRNVIEIGAHLDSIALLSDGTVYAWGNNMAGQLGDNSTEHRPTPVRVSGLSGIVGITKGALHNAALAADGTVHTWGANFVGQLGDGTRLQANAPVTVLASQGVPLTGIASIFAGTLNCYAITTQGAVLSWGAGAGGRVGDGENIDRVYPTQVFGLGPGSGVTAIEGGYSTALAIQHDTVIGWGGNERGQLALEAVSGRSTPVETRSVGGSGILANVVSVSAGALSSLALRSDGSIVAWGDNAQGQLGDGTSTPSATPVEVLGFGQALGDAVMVEAGYFNGYAVTSMGKVYAWGGNSTGLLGDGTTTSRSEPGTVKACRLAAGDVVPTPASSTCAAEGGTLSDLSSVSFVTADPGLGHAAAISDGKVFVWGSNSFGQLGRPTTLDGSTSALDVSGLPTAAKMVVTSGGGEYGHTLALLTNGEVWAWGRNANGQLGTGSTDDATSPTKIPGLSGVKAIATEGDRSMALLENGTLMRWGDGTTTAVAVPDVANVADLTMGTANVFVRLNDGTARSWGFNGVGQLGRESEGDDDTPRSVRICRDATSGATLGTPFGGTCAAIGGVLSDLTGITDIAAGQDHALAVVAGAVLAWGATDDGKLGDGYPGSASPRPRRVLPTSSVAHWKRGPNPRVFEDSGAQTLAGWASELHRAPEPDDPTRSFKIAANTNPELFSVQPAVDAQTGDLTFTAAADAFGTAVVSVVFSQPTGGPGGGEITSAPQTLVVFVEPVNDPPSFTKGADVEAPGNDRPIAFSGWATGMSAGPANESGQSLTFLLSVDRPDLFSILPTVDTAGTLRFIPRGGVSGVATVTAVLRDDGGRAGGGVDESAPQTFRITVTAVSAPPVSGGSSGCSASDGTSHVGFVWLLLLWGAAWFMRKRHG